MNWLPVWMTSDSSLAVATWGLVIATFLLVLATVFMWLDSKSKGKEQRERWRREDESVTEQRRPKCRFGLTRTRAFESAGAHRVKEYDHVALWIANLGAFPLHAKEFVAKWGFEGIRKVPIDRIVRPGGKIEIHIPNSVWDVRVFATETAEVFISMSDPFNDFETPHRLYALSVDRERGLLRLEHGTATNANIVCPKCGNRILGYLPTTACNSPAEYEEQLLKKVQVELIQSCPHHSSGLINFIEVE